MLDFFERYDSLIIPEPNSGCHIWIGPQTGAGYGHFRHDGIWRYAHRCAYEAIHGLGSLDGLLCRHSCDFPPCCNGDHLLKGTHHDNAMDSVRRGRARRAVGENAAGAVLTEPEVLSIRQAGIDGMAIKDIALAFEVHRNTVTAILLGESWPHLGPPVFENHIPFYRGEKTWNAVLTEPKVRLIKQRLKAGAKCAVLAREFGVSAPTISAIKSERNWAHVSGDANG